LTCADGGRVQVERSVRAAYEEFSVVGSHPCNEKTFVKASDAFLFANFQQQ
jgi:hypothetical protein